MVVIVMTMLSGMYRLTERRDWKTTAGIVAIAIRPVGGRVRISAH
jgi:hypothetical protein